MTTIEQYLDNGGDGAELPGLVEDARRALSVVADMTQRMVTNEPRRFTADEVCLAQRIREEIEEALDLDGKDDTK